MKTTTRYYHLLTNKEGDIQEQYLNGKSTKDYGLTQKSKQFNWTYEVNKCSY